MCCFISRTAQWKFYSVLSEKSTKIFRKPTNIKQIWWKTEKLAQIRQKFRKNQVKTLKKNYFCVAFKSGFESSLWLNCRRFYRFDISMGLSFVQFSSTKVQMFCQILYFGLKLHHYTSSRSNLEKPSKNCV